MAWPIGCLRLSSLCLVVVGAAVCVYYMYLSHLVYQIFISVGFKLQHFLNITSDNVMNHIKAFWHLYSSLRMLIVKWCSCQKIYTECHYEHPFTLFLSKEMAKDKMCKYSQFKLYMFTLKSQNLFAVRDYLNNKSMPLLLFFLVPTL